MAGALHLSDEDIWNTCPRLLIEMYNGFIESNEIIIQTIWEATRFTALSVLNSQGAKIKNPKRLIMFDWEKIDVNDEDFERTKNKFKKKLNGFK